MADETSDWEECTQGPDMNITGLTTTEDVTGLMIGGETQDGFFILTREGRQQC